MTDRIPLDHLTSDQYDELCNDLDRYEQIQGDMNERAIDLTRRAERAEAELAALRQVARAKPPEPNPPGSTREQLPPALLALINLPDYVSTACQTAIHLAAGPAPIATSSGAILDVGWYVDRLHARCRKNQKFTGQICICRCHTTAKEN